MDKAPKNDESEYEIVEEDEESESEHELEDNQNQQKNKNKDEKTTKRVDKGNLFHRYKYKYHF